MRAAYEAGAPGSLLNRLFHDALHAGKSARAQTTIAESPASVSSAGAALAQQVFGDLKGRRVLIVGAGKVGELAARNLAARGAELVAVVEPLRGAWAGAGASDSARRAVPMERLADELASRRRRRRVHERAGLPDRARATCASARDGRSSSSTSPSRATSIRP